MADRAGGAAPFSTCCDRKSDGLRYAAWFRDRLGPVFSFFGFYNYYGVALGRLAISFLRVWVPCLAIGLRAIAVASRPR